MKGVFLTVVFILTLMALLIADAAFARPPTFGSDYAARRTANTNALCTAVAPFYWEIGNKSGVLTSGQNGSAYSRTSNMSIASASKWLFATYVVQIRGGALTLTDIVALHQTDGYTNNPDNCAGGTASPLACTEAVNPANGLPYGALIPSTEGYFYYNSGHFEVLGATATPLASLAPGPMGTAIGAQEEGVDFTWTSPLLAGAAYGNAEQYATVLQAILGAKLLMIDALGTNPVCTVCASAQYSPIPVNWDYSMGHWVETTVDGAYSSAGSFGFYPWIDATKKYYGILARKAAAGSGYASAECGAKIRAAYMTGKVQ